jgi:hypothetical protein
LREIEGFVTRKGETVAGAVVSGTNPSQSLTERLLYSTSMAISEAMSFERPAELFPDPRRTAACFCLPAQGLAAEEFPKLAIDRLFTKFRMVPGSTETFVGGHAVGIRAIRNALKRIQAGDFDTVLVVAADSLVTASVLRGLEEEGRLKTPEHPEGLIPGEASACLVIERDSTARRRGAIPLARISNTGFTTGEERRGSDKIATGFVLTEAIRKALRDSPQASPFERIYCDLNGERDRMREWALARNRVYAGHGGEPTLRHPAELWGDIRAASAIVLVAIAALEIATERSSEARSLVWCASDEGERGAVAVESCADAFESRRKRVDTMPIRPAPRLWKSHADEAAFLYEMRYVRHGHPASRWDDLQREEERLAPHLAGLRLGGEPCARELRDRFLLDDGAWPGEVFVAAWACASTPRIEPVQWIAERLERTSRHAASIVHALECSDRGDLEHWVGDFLGAPQTALVEGALAVSAWRDFPGVAERIRTLTKSPNPKVAALALFAMANQGQPVSSEELLERARASRDPGVLRTVLRFLLRSGFEAAIDVCRGLRSDTDPEIRMDAGFLLAAIGTRRDREQLVQEASRETESAETALTAAFTGSPSAAEVLIERLVTDDPRCFRAAWQGLRLLSGRDDLLPPDPESATESDLSADRDRWGAWWKELGRGWDHRKLLRRGGVMDPRALAGDLVADGHPDRELAALQFAARFDCKVRFRMEDPFVRLTEASRSAEDWARSKEARRFDGSACFAGVPESEGGRTA